MQVGDRMELGYQRAPINQRSYNDGHMRTFRGHPKMSNAIKELLDEYIKIEEYQKVVLFFTGHCNFDLDYSEFLLREIIKGKL